MPDLIDNTENNNDQIKKKENSILLKSFISILLFAIISIPLTIFDSLLSNQIVNTLIICVYAGIVYLIVKKNKEGKSVNGTIIFFSAIFIFVILMHSISATLLLPQIASMFAFIFLNYHCLKTFNIHKAIISLFGVLSVVIVSVFSFGTEELLHCIDSVVFIVAMICMHHKFQFNPRSIFAYNLFGTIMYSLTCLMCFNLSYFIVLLLGFIAFAVVGVVTKRRYAYGYPIAAIAAIICGWMAEASLAFIVLLACLIHGIVMFIRRKPDNEPTVKQKALNGKIKTCLKAAGQMILIAVVLLVFLCVCEEFDLVDIGIIAPIIAILYSTLIFILGYQKRYKALCWIGALFMAILSILNELNGFDPNQMLYPYILTSAVIFISLLFITVITYCATININQRMQKIREAKDESTELIEDVETIEECPKEEIIADHNNTNLYENNDHN